MSSYTHKPSKNKILNNSNGKCGEITFCIQVGKRVYALNCLYCSQICLQWDMFINHMEQEHDADLSFNNSFQAENEEAELPMAYFPSDFVEPPKEQTVTNAAAEEMGHTELLNLDDPLHNTSLINASSSITIKSEKLDLPAYKDERDVLKIEFVTENHRDEELFPSDYPSVSSLCGVQMYDDHNMNEESKYMDKFKISNTDYDNANIYINIKELLNCFKGKEVLTYYQENNTLNNSNRRALCDLIIDKIFEQGFIGCKNMPKICEQIVEVFPTEDKLQYYVPRQFNSKRGASGFLFHRYYNRLKRIKARPIQKRTPKTDS